MALTLHYDFATDKSLVAKVGPTLSITRATDATYRDNTGTIQTASSGNARFDHDKDGNSLGLLVEEARTNICLQSEDFSTTWTAADATVTTNDTASPDGSTTADAITATAQAGAQTPGVFQTVTVSSGSTVLSAFVKESTIQKCALATQLFDASANGTTVFNINTGVVITQHANHDDSGIEDFGNGWYRCWVAFTTTTDLAGRVRVELTENDTLTRITDPDGTEELWFWGAQLEAGAFPTSYIPTVASSVTRNSDSVEASSGLGFYNNDAGTLYAAAQYLAEGLAGANAPMVELDGLGTLATHLRIRTNGNVEYNYFGDGLDSTITATDPFTLGITSQFAAAYAQDDAALYVDGSQIGTDSTIDIDSGTIDNKISIGKNAGGSAFWSGHISEVRYYNERLDNETLLNMSNGIFPSGLAFVNDLTRDLVRGLVSNLVR